MNNVEQWIKGQAKIVYSPNRPGLKKTRQAEDHWLIAEMSGDIAKYYSWWVKKALYLDLQLPAWKPHISVLNGRTPVQKEFQHLWKKHAGEIVEFEYSVVIEQHWKFWTLPVRSQRLDEIRQELGFQKDHKPHLTIGRMY